MHIQMAMLKRVIILFFAFALLLVPQTGDCLDTVEKEKLPFDTLNIGLRFSLNVDRNAFHEFWEPGLGAGGFIATPFYLGDLRVGADIYSYSSVTEKTSEFYDWYFFLGWRKRLPLLSCITWNIGFDSGCHYMAFDDEIEEGLRSETEFGIDANCGLSCSIGNKWFIDVLVDHQVIFTRKMINLTYVSAGISYSLKTPSWLQEILK